MKRIFLSVALFLCISLLSLSVNLMYSDTVTAQQPAAETNAKSQSPDKSAPVTLDVAKDRAKLMHDIYVVTMDVMHDRYFHGDRAMVPARAMEDVFSEMQRQTKSEANWIAVSLNPMSVRHEPKTAFEKKAAKELSATVPEIEIVEDGFYRRATAIPFADKCVHCHGGLFKEQPKGPKFAGLVISIPVITSEAK